ncbi:hypothetical protein T12_4663 [Trichinella patagoniensis]|uniref:Uncharacterized protein n=1 Tax=Trichinella patagoniensis TaxID=990121 RepID=A0A0V0ZGH3_9BILA|nr:hypothetical protein T12_4663 [Trichinella patagoniensis]
MTSRVTKEGLLALPKSRHVAAELADEFKEEREADGRQEDNRMKFPWPPELYTCGLHLPYISRRSWIEIKSEKKLPKCEASAARDGRICHSA